jgi:Ala-tRNA(Pro) deacylase
LTHFKYKAEQKMMTEPEQLFALFDRLEIKHGTVAHPPIFTVDEGRDWHDKIPGLHCKNLFMKDKKGKIWLAVMPGDKRANLGNLEKRVGAARLSFGKPELLMEVLGVPPGSVTPFALVNDVKRLVTVILDSDLLKSDVVNFHPLINTASTTLSTEDLVRFIKWLGYNPLAADCGA